MSLAAIDWSAVTKTTLLVLSPGASVLVLLAVEYLKVLVVSWVVLLRNRGVVAQPPASPSPKRRGRSSSRGRRSTSRGRRGRSASVGRPSEADSVATATVAASPSPRRRSAARVKRFVTSSIDLLVQVTSFLVLAHMLHLMGEEIVDMITETSTTATSSSILQIISSKMVIIAAIGAIKGFAVVGVLLFEDGTDTAVSSSPRRTSHHSAPAPSAVRRLLRNVQQYGLVIAMTLHTLSEGVAAALVDSRAAAPTQAAASTANLLTPYFLALIAHNICEGLVVSASVKSKASTSASVSGSWKKKKLPMWFISAAIQSITAHIAQPLAYGATTLFIGSSIATKLQVAIGSNSIIMTMMPMEAVPILISSFALGSLLGAVVFEVAPAVISALTVTRHNF